MQAIIVRDRGAGVNGLVLHPRAAQNDVLVRVHAAGFTRGELDWPGTWSPPQGAPAGAFGPLDPGGGRLSGPT